MPPSASRNDHTLAGTLAGVLPPATPPEASTAPERPLARNYPQFLLTCWRIAFRGSPLFYGWMIILTAVALVGLHAYGLQLNHGLALSGMSDHVSWGLYIANFTFTVGLAAAAVLMAVPAYLYREHAMHEVAIVGELLAIASVVVALAFVIVDLGRPEHLWHMLPFIGRFNWPVSMLSWDVIVLSGYLLINLHVTGYLIYQRYRGQEPSPRWYVPLVLLSIGWAISIHTVTAFLYSGLGGRPFWNSAILAPRFLASAFVSGPALILVVMHLLRRLGGVRVPLSAQNLLLSIVKVTVLIHLFFLGSELFTHFYSGGHHRLASDYLYFGLHGRSGLVPWSWAAVLCVVLGTLLLYTAPRPKADGIPPALLGACALLFAGVWIEKGMGLIVPGFIPSTLGEVVEYRPSLIEWQVVAGIWALGAGILTLALKITVQIFAEGVSHPVWNARREGTNGS